MRIRAWAACATVVACMGCGADEGSASAQSPSVGARGSAAPASAADTTQGRGTERVRFDLSNHLERAELRQGSAQVIDFGGPASAMYTLGGWRTRAGRSVRESDGTTSVAIENVTGFVLTPVDDARDDTLRVRARAPRDGQVTIYAEGQTIGRAQIPTDGYGVFRVALPSAHVHRGENSIQFRVGRTGSAPGVTSAGMLIDWVRIGPEDDPHAEDPPPSLQQLAPRAGVLTIPDGWTIGFASELVRGARLLGNVSGNGSIEVSAHRDNTAPIVLGSLRSGAFDIDLTRVHGEMTRLDFAARGSVTLVRPRISTFDGVSSTRRPNVRNVIVYLTDTLRADKLRPYRRESRVRTPALDQWVSRAALMVRGHSQENWTKPSVATLLSGLYPWEHGAFAENSVVPGSVDLLSERLGGDGFYTGAFIANGFCSDTFGFRQGWNTFRNYIREGLRTQAQFVAADVIEWLDRRPSDRPFFLYVHTIDPHVPYMPPAEALALYDPESYAGVVDFSRNRELLEGIKVGRIRLSARDRTRLEALYDGEITYHDTHFGAIMDALRTRGLDDSTAVVFTADHGEEFWDHDSVGHGHSVYEELIRVPLIVRIPGLTDGAMRIEDSVGLVDVIPTLYEAMGKDVPQGLSGRSFLPQLLGQTPDAPRYVVTQFMDGWRAISMGRWKLVHRTERHILLFDLDQDPSERNDVAAQHPLIVRHLRGLLGLGLATRASRSEVRREQVRIDETTRAQLEALGYAGASRPSAPPEE